MFVVVDMEVSKPKTSDFGFQLSLERHVENVAVSLFLTTTIMGPRGKIGNIDYS